MDTCLARATTWLDKGALLRIADASGQGIAVFAGSVWVTQDGDRRDHMLERGGTMHFDRAGLVIVQALEPTSLLVFGVEPAANAATFDGAIDAHRNARRLRAQAIGAALEHAASALKHGIARALDAVGSAATAAARRLAA